MIAVYARVSTEDQAKNGYSLKDQIRECTKLAGGEEIIEYSDEGISGEILDRPALTALRADVRRGLVSRIICLDPDRLSRKLMIQLIISEELERRAELVFVNGKYGNTAEGRLFYQLRGAISEFEKSKIMERTSRGRREKARQGKVIRNYGIYGYDYDRNAGMLVINPAEAEVVKTVFHLFTGFYGEFKGISDIADYLSKTGFPTKRGAPVWHRQVVRQILMNRTYTGILQQNVWDSEGLYMNRFKPTDERRSLHKRPESEWIATSCPVIIDEETFMLARKLLEFSRRRYAGSIGNGYLLSGLVRCGLCGNTMTGRKANNWGRYVLEYAERKKKVHTEASVCCRNRIKAETLETIVLNILSVLFSGALTPDSDSFDTNGFHVRLIFGKYGTAVQASVETVDRNAGQEDKKTLIRRMISEIRVYKDEIQICFF